MKVWVGIDPGLTGAVALIHGESPLGGVIEIFDAPIAVVKKGKKKQGVPLPDEMARIFYGIRDYNPIVYIEQVHAMRKQGVTSMFNFGMGYGMWIGILAALSIPYQLVTPQRWKKEMMHGMVTAEKDASLVQAKRLFPQVAEQLQRKKDDGRAEALLIAALCRKENP